MPDENIEDKLKNTELPEQGVQTSPQTEDITDKLNEQNKEKGSELGFHAVESGPLVRSSYHAHKHAK